MKVTILAAGAAMALASAAGAQTSPAFLTGGYGDGPIYRVQGGAVTHTAYTNGWTPAMAILGGKVQPAGYGGGGSFAELNSSDLSPTGNNISANPSTYGGTSDGKKIFFYNNNTSQIYSADPGWTNQQFLANSPYGFAYDLGYDASDNTLWGSTSGSYWHIDMAGNPLGSFGANNGSGTGIGVDNADGTIWMTQYCSNSIVQYDKSGNYMNTINFGGNIRTCGEWGIDFETKVPAPGSAALLGFGGLMASRRRR